MATLFRKGNKSLQLIQHTALEKDEDGEWLLENWEIKVSDGRQYKFASQGMAMLFISQNCWEPVAK